MAGQEGFLLDGGIGALPSLQGRNTAGSGLSGGSMAQPHHGAIFLVLAAVAILYALDKFGFRFAVTAGRR